MNPRKNRFILPGIIGVGGIAVVAVILANRQPSTKARGHDDADPQLSFRSEIRPADEDTKGSRRRIQEPGARSLALYESTLEKYPDMKPSYRDVPDDQNGYLQLLQIVEEWDFSILPDHLRGMLEGKADWDAGKLRAWYGEHRALINEVLAIAALPDRSTKGIGFGRLYRSQTKTGISDLGKILTGLSRMTADDGDDTGALRFLSGVKRLGAHLSGTEAPSMLAKVLEEGMRAQAEKCFSAHHLERLADKPKALRQWRDALHAPEDRAEETRRALLGEWNYMMRVHLTPFMTGEGPVFSEKGYAIKDQPGFIAAYTRTHQAWMAELAAQPPGRFDISQWKSTAATGGLDAETAAMLQEMLHGIDGIVPALGTTATRSVRDRAAISILLGEEPPVDPVSGQPYRWDPATRTLSPPGDDDPDEAIQLPDPGA